MAAYSSNTDTTVITEELANSSEEVFVFPTSFAQARLWFLNQLTPNNPFYNVSTALRLLGELNLAALKQAFNEIVRRHETLRTTFALVEGQPVQAIAPTLTIPLSLTDLRYLPASTRETETRRIATLEANLPFNLATGPLLRIKLIQLDETEYILLLNLHHIVADGWSIGVLVKELSTLYTAFCRNDTGNVSVSLPDLPIQYADYAQWQHDCLQDGSSILQTQLHYWQQQLDGISVLNLPTDKPRLAIPTYRGAKQCLELSSSINAALEALSQKEGVTLFMTLLAAFQILLYRYTNQEDIAIGSPIANRNRSEIEGLIGFFVNSLVLRTDLSGNPTFRELLSRVKKVATEAYAHQDLPFEKLVQKLHPERDLSRNPLFQVSFSLQNTPVQALDLPGITLSTLDFDIDTAKLDLEFHLWQCAETLHTTSLRGQIIYSTDVFEDATITRMLGHFQTLLEGIITNPEQRLAELPILTNTETQQLLIDWSNNFRGNDCITAPQQLMRYGNTPPALTRTLPLLSRGVGRGNCCIFHHLFEQQVEQTPDAIAVVFEQQRLTYRELNTKANQVAHYLQQLGIAPDIVVGIYLERSLEMIVGLLGILKAGGAYLPLDPSYPQERLHYMVKDAKVSVIVTLSSIAQLKKEDGQEFQPIPLVYLDKDWEKISQNSQQNPINSINPNNLAYIIYTSGSTGKPKGVLIEHRGLGNMAKAQIEVFNVQLNARILQFASLSFDASIFEIVMALTTGASLYLAKQESLLPGKPLIQLLRNHAITHVTLPPAVLAALPIEPLPALQTIIAAGEKCSQEIVKRWAKDRSFFNAYGPTEATVWATIAEVSVESEKLSIGRPIHNTQVYILDKNLQPVPIGIPGEIYISGDGIARGYLNLPDLTAEKFLPNLFIEVKKVGEWGSKGVGEWGSKKVGEWGSKGVGENNGNKVDKGDTIYGYSSPVNCHHSPFTSHQSTIYKTGDLARYLPDGNIEFLGRIDEQVKIRGFRIELTEIEAVLRQHPLVKDVVVLAVSNSSTTESQTINQRLVAYIIPNLEALDLPSKQTIHSNELRQFLKEKLPEYMVPSIFISLDSFPLTNNGKVNRAALAALDLVNQTRETDFVAPRNAVEDAIARIWQEILNLECVSINDNFFNVGGDSLLAINLVERINKQFEQPLSLSELFLNPTIANLANLLSSPTVTSSWSPLVAIQSYGSKPPFFCVHPIFGVVLPYYELADYLGTDQPFYGLQPVGIDGKKTPLTRIEDMAAYYIKALRTVQPQGPYYIGGWSFGGWVAFEMAQQLQKSGQEVALLALFDTLAPIPSNKPSVWDSFKFIVTKISRYIWPFVGDYLSLLTLPIKNHETKHLSKSQRLKNNFSLSSILGKATIATLISQESRKQILNELAIQPIIKIFYANSKATLNYTPQTYQQQITLFKAEEQTSIAHQNSTLGWSELTSSEVEVYLVPGNHLNMLKKPQVQILGEKLKAALMTNNSKLYDGQCSPYV